MVVASIDGVQCYSNKNHIYVIDNEDPALSNQTYLVLVELCFYFPLKITPKRTLPSAGNINQTELRPRKETRCLYNGVRFNTALNNKPFIIEEPSV